MATRCGRRCAGVQTSDDLRKAQSGNHTASTNVAELLTCAPPRPLFPPPFQPADPNDVRPSSTLADTCASFRTARSELLSLFERDAARTAAAAAAANGGSQDCSPADAAGPRRSSRGHARAAENRPAGHSSGRRVSSQHGRIVGGKRTRAAAVEAASDLDDAEEDDGDEDDSDEDFQAERSQSPDALRPRAGQRRRSAAPGAANGGVRSPRRSAAGGGKAARASPADAGAVAGGDGDGIAAGPGADPAAPAKDPPENLSRCPICSGLFHVKLVGNPRISVPISLPASHRYRTLCATICIPPFPLTSLINQENRCTTGGVCNPLGLRTVFK